jgi:hypothetical protein
MRQGELFAQRSRDAGQILDERFSASLNIVDNLLIDRLPGTVKGPTGPAPATL